MYMYQTKVLTSNSVALELIQNTDDYGRKINRTDFVKINCKTANNKPWKSCAQWDERLNSSKMSLNHPYNNNLVYTLYNNMCFQRVS